MSKLYLLACEVSWRPEIGFSVKSVADYIFPFYKVHVYYATLMKRRYKKLRSKFRSEASFSTSYTTYMYITTSESSICLSTCANIQAGLQVLPTYMLLFPFHTNTHYMR